MSSQVLTLSESNGGAPILLDSSHLPGKLIHLNPEDSGGNDLICDILIGNLNTRQISIWTKIMGPGVDPVYDRSEMLRIDVPPSAEGTQVRKFYTPFVLEPGFSYYISVDLQPGDVPPYLYGYVERYDVEPEIEPVEGGGYGGLLLPESQFLGTLTFDWRILPWTHLSIQSPLNFTADLDNNRFKLNAPGVWYLSLNTILAFSGTNTGRTTYFQIFDETQNQPISMPIPMFAGRDEEGASGVIAGSLFEVEEIEVEDWNRIEIGGGDTFNNTTIELGEVSLVRINDTTGAQRAALGSIRTKRERPRRRRHERKT